MNNYEGLFLLKPDLEKEELGDLYQKIGENIKKYKGEIENAEEWGKKPLAHKTAKQKEGIYYLLKFKLDPDKVKALQSDFKLNEKIIRTAIASR